MIFEPALPLLEGRFVLSLMLLIARRYQLTVLLLRPFEVWKQLLQFLILKSPPPHRYSLPN